MTATPPKTANGNAGAGNSNSSDDEKKPDARTPAPKSEPAKKQDLLKGTKPLTPAADEAGDRVPDRETSGEAGGKTAGKTTPDAPSAPKASPAGEKPRAARRPITRRLWPEKDDTKERAEKETQTAEADKKTETKAEATVDTKADASESAARKPIDPAAAHVLVVEDNVPNFVLIARLLAYTGVEKCEWKTSGWQVVEFADTLARIDLILMDIRLPYEDGFQALEKVRAHPRFKNTLVVAVTAEASVEQMRRAKEAGFDGFLGKPLDPDKFPDQIRRVLNGQPVWEIR